MLGRWTTMLLALAGCDTVFQLDRGDGGGDVDAPVLACPPSFREINGGYYQRFDAMVSWYEAGAACDALRDPALTGHTHLAVISKDAEYIGIQASLTIDLFWIGHHDLEVENTFVPVTRETVDWPPPTTPPWAGGQPNNLNENQHCLIVDNQDLLDDKGCANAELFRYVCECDLFASNTPLPP